MVQLVNGMEYDVNPALSCESIVCSIQFAPSVFSQVDMFHAIAAAARGGHHFIYTVYLCIIANYIVKLNDAL